MNMDIIVQLDVALCVIGADDFAPLPQGGVEQLLGNGIVADAGDRRGDDMGDMTK